MANFIIELIQQLIFIQMVLLKRILRIFMNNHSFDVNIAIKYGVPVAIVINHLAFWIQKNKANEKHFYEGRYWTYNSIKAFQELFPYWSFKQMRTVLDKVKESGLILTGNFNQIGYDQTLWYGLSDEGLKLFNMLPAVDNFSPICPNGQMEKPRRANRFDEKGKPIPDIKPDIKPDNKSFCENEQKRNKPVKMPTTTDWKEANQKKHTWAEKKTDAPLADVTSQSTSYDPD